MAFREDSTDTYTFPSNSTGSTVDLGARNNYRYVNATNVYNKGKADGVTTHTGTYTFASGSTGSTVDLGTTHTYRYVNAENVYNKGKADGKAATRFEFLGMTGYGSHLFLMNSNGKIGFARNGVNTTLTGIFAIGYRYPSNTQRFEIKFTSACKVFHDNNYTSDTTPESTVTVENKAVNDTLILNGYDMLLITDQ